MKSVALLHLYELSGSGSCLYVRFLAEALSQEGLDVHLVSAERRPEDFPWIREAHVWRPPGSGRAHFSREGAQGCTAHRLELERYPVAYPRFEMQGLPTTRMVDLSDSDLDTYLDDVTRILGELVTRTGVQVLFVQHVLPLALAAARIKKTHGIPYVITIHGTMIEYAVNVQERYRHLAVEGLHGADAVIALNPDVERRICAVSPEVRERVVRIPIGIPLDRWLPVPRGDRRQRFLDLLGWHGNAGSNGMPEDARLRLHEAVREEWKPQRLLELLAAIRGSYSPTSLDQQAPARLSGIDWDRDPIVFFLGKHLIDKGIHCLLSAFPSVLDEFPRARLIIGGNGVFREGLEVFLSALDLSRFAWLESMAPHLRTLDPGGVDLAPIVRSAAAHRSSLRPDEGGLRERVHFTGYLSREWLRRLLPLSDVSAISSVIPEALPLAAAESLASGVPIVGPRQGGLTELLGQVDLEIPELSGGLSYDPRHEMAVEGLADRIRVVLRTCREPLVRTAMGTRLHQFAVDRFHVRDVARRMIELYGRIRRG